MHVLTNLLTSIRAHPITFTMHPNMLVQFVWFMMHEAQNFPIGTLMMASNDSFYMNAFIVDMVK